jgi:hypothetical protein
MAEFTAQIVSIGQLLAHPVQIEAPSYQRSFAWSGEEAGQLLADILAALGETERRIMRDYFLGTMLFIDRDGAPSRLTSWRRGQQHLLEVVDGFQRLTTLTILLCVLRDLEADAGGPTYARLQAAVQAGDARPRLSLRPAEDPFFLKNVRTPGGTRQAPIKGSLSPAEANIVEVRDHFIACLRGCEAAERRQLADFLLDQCFAVMVATGDIDRAHRIFTVLNARGKPLARNDILKAILLGGVAREAAGRCAAIWNETELRAGPRFESLFSHIRAMYGRPGGEIISGILEVSQAKGGARAFIEGVLQPVAQIVADIQNAQHAGSPDSERIANHLRYLGWHSFSDWIAPAALWWLERGEDTQGLERFLARLDRLAFGTKVLGIGGSKRTRRFGAVVAAIRDGRDLYAADSPLEFTRPELRTIQHNLRDLHARNPAVAKQLLLRLTDVKAGTPQSLTLPTDMTVEHVLPRTLRSDCQWRHWHSDPETRETCTESIGNLVLVTKGQNDKAGNHDFARKLQVYFNTRGAPMVAINEHLRGKTEWKAADIRAREAAIFELIEELWQFGLLAPKAKAA